MLDFEGKVDNVSGSREEVDESMGPQKHNQRSRSSAFIAVLRIVPVGANLSGGATTCVLSFWKAAKLGSIRPGFGVPRAQSFLRLEVISPVGLALVDVGFAADVGFVVVFFPAGVQVSTDGIARIIGREPRKNGLDHRLLLDVVAKHCANNTSLGPDYAIGGGKKLLVGKARGPRVGAGRWRVRKELLGEAVRQCCRRVDAEGRYSRSFLPPPIA